MSPGKISVLYVDDEQDLLNIGKIFLEKTGDFSVTICDSASAGLEILRNEPFDAIISDYQMPKMDGLEFLVKVRELYKDLPFILFTGRGREEVVILALNSGANFYLQKGGDPKPQFVELAHKIRQAVKGRHDEEALRESEEKFRVLADTAPAAIIVFQGERNVYVNDYTAQVTGYSKEELCTMNFWEYFHPDCRNLIKERGLGRQEKSRDAVRYEIQYITKSGNVKWADLTAGNIVYDGKPAGVAMLVDITERKRAEEELQGAYEQLSASEEELREQYRVALENQRTIEKSEADYRSILENIQDVYYRTDKDGNLILASPSMARVLGYESVSELYGHDIATTLYNDPSERTEILSILKREGSITNHEITMKKRDGTPVIVLASSHEYYDNEGHFLGVEGIFRDITDRKKIEVSLQESENLYRTIFDMTGAGTIIIDADTRILLANSGFARLSGYTIKELEETKRWTDFVVPEDLERMRKYHHDRRDLPVNAPRVYEFRFVNRNGEIRHCINNVGMIPGTDHSVASVVDITDRVVAEQAMKESESQYRTIFENSGAPTIIIAPDMTILLANAGWERLTGVPRSEQEHIRRWTDFAYPDDVDMLQRYHQERRRSGSHPPKTYESKVIDAEGNVHHCVVFVDLIPGSQNSVASLIDISDRIHAEDALKEQEEKFRTLVNQSLDGIIIIDYTGLVLFINRSAERLVKNNGRLDFIRKVNVFEFITPEYRDQVSADLRQVISGIDSYLAVYKVFSLEKDEIWIEVIGKNITYEGEQAIFLSIRDITEQQKTREALLESEAKYRSIIENLQDLVYQTDLDGNLTMISPAGAGIAGAVSPDELIGWNFASEIYADPKERDGYCAALEQYGEVKDYPLTLIDRKGVLHHVTVNSHYYYDSQGNKLGVEGIVHDVTTQKQVEEALLQVNRKLNLLSSITRHDINNQLMILKGNLEILESDIPEIADNRYFVTASETADRIDAMIQFAAEYEQIDLTTPVWQEIRTLVDEAFSETAQGKFTLDNCLPAGLEVYADPLLAKVVYNLMENAIRYSGKAPSIRFSVREAGNERILICEDDGEGVLPDEKERIFERGYGRNTGLGLALSREILSLTGISITETGEAGKGARFEITVPERVWRLVTNG